MATRRPNPAAIAALRRRPSEAQLFPGELRSKLRRAQGLLEELAALATQLPEELAPPFPEKAAGTIRGARRALEKWVRAAEEAHRTSRQPGR
ncbi:hypothetical protein BH23GEM7_BH23GEM7_27080 [soil metagenome]|jgi:hypothetical protein